ncbi:MAG: NAD-dependent deacylase [Saprospiraceae bacterium]|nr:NAD-dependent deacylase [Saprospiraceae bacterium]MBK8370620.1 NAD-dependent deacylase [Saprospiraceae bacterium]MBK8546460.1 NAD-dependent deacylase [Saprospiraceae bacterium]MBK8854528.1 NAD-dependent deacylase [Saprospiraceae bacterium]MBP6694373.1 NAD-dependent deacylase [Saprospiraceae bacterium]
MHISILTGAGISAESGISTFRDAGGLWEGHRIEDVASPEGWFRNQKLVLDFYNKRRSQLKEVKPNVGHSCLVQLEKHFNTTIITQNVDDLHERAGSTKVIHLHGELKKARSTGDETLLYNWEKDLNTGDLCEKGYQLRPHIVWFGEEVPKLYDAANIVKRSDILIIVGTSLQVYPAAGLVGYAPASCLVYYVDPKPFLSYELKNSPNVQIISKSATEGLPSLVNDLIKIHKK